MVRVNVQTRTQRDDADGKLVVNYVLMERAVVTVVGVEQHDSLVELISVKANVQPRSHGDDGDGKLLVEDVLMECVVVSLVGVETHQTIVLPINVKNNVKHHSHPHLHPHLHLPPHPHHHRHLHPHPRPHPHLHLHLHLISHQDDAEGKLVVDYVLSESVVVDGVGVELRQNIVLIKIVKVSAEII